MKLRGDWKAVVKIQKKKKGVEGSKRSYGIEDKGRH